MSYKGDVSENNNEGRKMKTRVFYFIRRGRNQYLLLDGGGAVLKSLSEDIYCVNNIFAGTSYSLDNFVEQVNCVIK
jgi:hypothetical protein